MEHINTELFYSMIQQVMRTGEILSRVRQLLSEPEFVDIIHKYALSQQDATAAIKLYENLKPIVH